MILFKELLIVDLNDKLAKHVTFDEKINLITSEKNSRGKSIIMRSLYHALGANAGFDHNFDHNSKIYYIVFTNKNNEYCIARYQDEYIIYKNDSFVNKFSHGEIIKLSEYYYNEFNFGIYLHDRENKITLAPPAFSFVPYYLDQDKSWKKQIEPFEKLQQFMAYSRNNLYYYHLDLYNEKYIKDTLEIENLNKVKSDAEKKYEKQFDSYEAINKQLNMENVHVNIKELEIFFDKYRSSTEENLKKISKLKKDLYELDSKKTELIIEKNGIRKIINNIDNKSDYLNAEVTCPNCGNSFEVSLEEEIEKLYNKIYLKDRLLAIDNNLEILNNKSKIITQEIENYYKNISSIEKDINEKNDLYKKYLNKKAMLSVLPEMLQSLASLDIEIKNMKSKISILEEAIESFRHQKTIVHKLYIDNYSKFLKSLNITNFDKSSIKPFYKLTIGGSQYVRSTLAQFFAFLHTKHSMESKLFEFPIVIDSPREGEQDDDNSRDILKFILDIDTFGYQLIIASVNADKFIDLDERDGINVIELTNEKYKLLNAEDFKNHYKTISKISAAMNLPLYAEQI